MPAHKLLLPTKGVLSHSDYSQHVPQGFTDLHLAAYFGLENMASLLIQRYYQSSMTDSLGRTSLIWAAFSGHKAMIKLLLDNSIDAHAKDVEGQTPMTVAASMGWVGVVNLLLEHHVDPDSRDIAGQTPFIRAAHQGHGEVVQLLLEKGASPGSKDEDGQTALSWAASNGWVGIVQLLLEQQSVELDSKDIHGRTPLSHTTENGHAAVVELLLEKGAQPDSRDAEGHTPLFRATHYAEAPSGLFWTGHGAVSRLLQERSACLGPGVFAIHDLVMQHTPEQVAQHGACISSHPLALKHQDTSIFKCPLCLGEEVGVSNSIGSLTRHIDKQHYPQKRYYCPELKCGKQWFLNPNKAATHFDREHHQRLVTLSWYLSSESRQTIWPLAIS